MSAWYEPDGLRFECTMCGACCSGGEGFVLFNDAEAAAIAKRLGVSVEAFLSKFTHMTEAGRSLIEVKTLYGLDCVFLDRVTVPGKAVCSLYEDRPTQCRTFPFWPEHIESRRAWQRLNKHCEGVNKGGFVPAESIRIQRDEQRKVDVGRGG
jgi:Fe-S-cluster containining protein